MVQYAYINQSYRGLTGMAAYINDSSGGILTPLLLAVSWIVILVSQLEYGFPRALMTSSLIASILAIILTVTNFLAPSYMYATFVIFGLAVLLNRLTNTP